MNAPTAHSTQHLSVCVATVGGPHPWSIINAFGRRFGPIKVILQDPEPRLGFLLTGAQGRLDFRDRPILYNALNSRRKSLAVKRMEAIKKEFRLELNHARGIDYRVSDRSTPKHF